MPLVVRSSASHEDAVGTSFAGIYRSVLDVRERVALAKAVEEVLDSFWSEAARTYRRRFRIRDGDGAMAVLIMPLLKARVSGVAFTCDPITGRDDRVVIQATRGLADALVNGKIQGDEYVLESSYPADRLQIVGRRVGPTADGSPAGAAALEDKAILELGERVREVADALDYTDPSFDIEWVWDGQSFWVVQARPVTIRGHRVSEALRGQSELWSRANSREVVPHPFAALDWCLARRLLPRMLTCTAELAGYRPLDGARRIALRRGRLFFETSIMQWEAFDAFGVSPAAFNRLLGGRQPEIFLPKAFTWDRLARSWRSLRFLYRSIIPRLRAERTLRQAHEAAAADVRATFPEDNRALGRLIRGNFETLLGSRRLFLLQAAGSALFLVADVLEKTCGDQAHELAAALMTGGRRTITATQNHRLLLLAQLARNDSAVDHWLRNRARTDEDWRERLPRGEFRDGLEKFLDDFGHRGVYESYLLEPRWRESPGYLFDVIASLKEVPPSQVEDRQATTLAAAEKRLREMVPFWIRPTVRLLVKVAQSERAMREGARSAVIARLAVIRRLVLELAARLHAANGWQSADIFHLTFTEIFLLADGEISATTAQRRAEWRRRQWRDFAVSSEADLVIEPRCGAAAGNVEWGGKSIQRHPVTDSGEWFGTVIAAGSASGPAHVARLPAEAVPMKAGSILVAPATDPSWTPIFLKAAAVIVEVGGYLSHSAIVAREFGIPAIANVDGILERVATGDQLEVDGRRGSVRLVARARRHTEGTRDETA